MTASCESDLARVTWLQHTTEAGVPAVVLGQPEGPCGWNGERSMTLKKQPEAGHRALCRPM